MWSLAALVHLDSTSAINCHAVSCTQAQECHFSLGEPTILNLSTCSAVTDHDYDLVYRP